MPELVLSQIDRGVALVTLNRPERLNAINAEMGPALDQTLVEVGNNPDVRAVVLTGAGRGFCAGADASRLEGLAKHGPAGAAGTASIPPGAPHPVYDQLAGSPPEYRGRYTGPAALNQPVIAAVNGHCVGVGLALAVACDVRFAAEGAVFRAIFAGRGLVAEWGLARSLTDLVGRGWASDILLSARKVDAAEALRLGLVNAVLPPDQLLDHALAYARNIADTLSPRSTRVIKRQLQQAQNQTYVESLGLAYQEVVASLESEDFREGVEAFKAKRPASYQGR